MMLAELFGESDSRGRRERAATDRSGRWRAVRSTGVVVALLMSVLVVGLVSSTGSPAYASPYALNAGNDPRVQDLAHCPGGFGATGGAKTYCRVNGVTLTATSGVGSRFAGQYATVIDTAGNGLSPIGGPYQADDVVVYVTCGQDAGTHPATTGYTSVLDGQTAEVALNGPIAHPEVLDAYLFSLAASVDDVNTTAVPGGTSGIVYTPSEWAAASFTLGKYLVGDRSGGVGTVVVSSITDPWSGPAGDRVENLIAEILATAASDVQLHGTFDATPTATVADFQVQEVGTLYDGSPTSLNGTYGATVRLTSVTNLVFPDGSPLPIGVDLYSLAGVSPYVHYNAGNGVYDINAKPAGPGTVAFTLGRIYQTRASWVATPNAGGQQQGMAYWQPFNADLVGGDSDVFVANSYFFFQKRSTDPTISVAGGTFELRDANGAVLASWTSDGTGNQAIGPLNLAGVPRPISFVETASPTGLSNALPIALDDSPPFPPFSSDPLNPTTVTMNDSPRLDRLAIHKVVTNPALAPGGDFSGFVFSITRNVDGLVPVGSPATTNNLGDTPVINAPLGVYTVCEVGEPAWALASTNSPGCQQVTLNGAGVDVTFDFTNVAVAPAGATEVSTAVAGPGDLVVEHVWTRGLPVAGRLVNVSTSWFGVPFGTAPTCSALEQVGAPIVQQVTLGDPETVTSQPPFPVPTAVSPFDYFAVSTVSDVQTGFVYFVSTCGDPLERVSVPTISTTAPAVLTATTAQDAYTVDGVPFGAVTVSASASFDLHQASTFACTTPTSAVISTATSTVTTNGGGVSGAVNIPSPGSVYQFVETLQVTSTRTSTPGGFTIPVPGSDAAVPLTTTATIPGQGGCTETTPFPNGSTQVRDKVLIGQPLADTLVTTGFGTTDFTSLVWPSGPQVGKPIFSNVVANFTLHVHSPSTPLAGRVCDTSNQIGAATSPITGDGTVSISIADYTAAAGQQTSFAESYSGDRLNQNGTVTHWVTPQTGCREISETAIVPVLSTQVTAPFLDGVQNSTDDVKVVGVGDGSVLAGWKLSIDAAMYNHGDGTAVSSWTCGDANLIAPIPALVPVPTDGTYTTGGITPAQYLAKGRGGATSYGEQFVVTRPDMSTFTSPSQGCQQTSETSWIPQGVTQLTSRVVMDGRPLVDQIITSGFGTSDVSTVVWPSGPQAGRPVLSNVVAHFSLHTHAPTTPPASWVCDASNQIATTSIGVNGDGSSVVFISDTSAATGLQTSFAEWYTAELLNQNGSVTQWMTSQTGCTETGESAIVPKITSQVTAKYLNGGDNSVDTVTVTGLGDGSLLAGYKVGIGAAIYAHPADSDPVTWECNYGNELARVPAVVPVTADGTYTLGGITPEQYGQAGGGAFSYQAYLIITWPDGLSYGVGAQGCKDPSEASWVPGLSTGTFTERTAAASNHDVGTVTGVPAETTVSIRLDVFRLVPGNPAGITAETVCSSSPPVHTDTYTAQGSGDHVSPDYLLPANEVAGVQYVHQETLMIGGKQVAQERCGAVGETTTVVRPHKNGKLITTS